MGYTTIVDENEHITVNEDNTRVLNLDALFEGHLTSYPESILEGKPTQTIYAEFNSPVKLVDDAGHYFSPGGWDENHFHRKEYMGELVQGPQMFGTLHSTVISAHPDPRKETAYRVNDGDIVIFLGAKFKAVRKRWENRLQFERI